MAEWERYPLRRGKQDEKLPIQIAALRSSDLAARGYAGRTRPNDSRVISQGPGHKPKLLTREAVSEVNPRRIGDRVTSIGFRASTIAPYHRCPIRRRQALPQAAADS